MKIILSINDSVFEVPDNVKNIKIDMTNNHNFDTDTYTDEDSFIPKPQIKVVYTITFYNPRVFYDKKNNVWCHRDRFVEKKANSKDEVKDVIQKYIKKVGCIDFVGIFYIKVQHLNADNEIIYEKKLGKYKITYYEEIISRKELKETSRPIYTDALNEVKWRSNDEYDENEFLLVSRRHNGLEVEEFPQDVNLIDPDLTKYIYYAKQR